MDGAANTELQFINLSSRVVLTDRSVTSIFAPLAIGDTGCARVDSGFGFYNHLRSSDITLLLSAIYLLFLPVSRVVVELG